MDRTFSTTRLVHRLFRDSPIPRYVQLADLLRGRISRGQWRSGDRVPTLEELTREFDVARVTVRQAVEVLSREGLLSAQQGRGTFVTGTPQRARGLRLQTSLAELAEVYRDDRPQLTLIEEASAVPALEPGEGNAAPRYHFMRRVHSRDGASYCVISIYLDHRVFRMAPSRFRRETVIPVLLELPRVRIAQASQTLAIAAADVEAAGHLGLPVNAPVAEVRRVCRDPEGTVIYLGLVTYRGDHVRLEMDLQP
jgi:GntR family transcriptional regulator